MSDEMEVNYWNAYKLVDEYGLLSIPDDSDGVLQVSDALQAAERRGMKRACKIVRSECKSCDNGVFEMALDSSGEPYPVECEYCGRPIAHIRRQLEKESE